MFHNLFDSFHNTVVIAKEEREQLDHLLTISTPRERLVVSAIAVLMLVLGAWLFFGSMARSHSVQGVLVGQGEDPSENSRSVQVLAWVGSDADGKISAGMPVEIELNAAGGEANSLGGTIRAISVVPFSGELAASEAVAPESVRRFEIVLEEDREWDSLAGRECRMVIELDRQPPIALFLLTRS